MRYPSHTISVALAAVLTLAGAATPVRADDKPEAKGKDQSAEYVEYRSLPELGQIQISTGVARGDGPVRRLAERPEEFAKRGIFPCADKSARHTYHRTETMAGHVIDTTLIIDPPEEKKPDAAPDEEPTWRRHVVVRIDGRKKFNCSIGDSPAEELTVYGITIFPEDGTVDAAASDYDGYELVLPEQSLKIDSPEVITDKSFEEEDPADDAPDEKPPAPVKVIAPGDVAPTPLPAPAVRA
jgi:hypothetical protein